jgi:hypothetical protein
MCVSMDEAEFFGTIVFCGRIRHAEHGLVHVLGYQNTAVNLASGPNAMLLHLPTRALTPRQFLPVGRAGDVLQRMVDAVTPAAAAASMGMDPEPGSVVVFDHDVYTVVLAGDPTAIPEALDQVRPNRRPSLDPDLLRFYADHFPGHTIALCCFDNADAQQAKPLLLWYPPHDPDLLTVPALDCHTGKAPDLDATVPVDHWVLFATDEAPQDWGNPVEYPADMRHSLRDFLPDTVLGSYYGDDEELVNGDFAIGHRDLLDGALDRVTRLRPSA